MTRSPARTLVRTTDDDDCENDGIFREETNNSLPAISNVPSLVCAFSASATTGGTSYAFGLYAAALKRDLGLTQGQLDSISTAFFVAGLFSFGPGYCSDRFGTRFSLTMGGMTACFSLLLYWAVARQFIEMPHNLLVLVLSALGVFIFLSCALVTGAVFKIIVAATGPGTKGTAVGAAKGYVGLGAGLYACLFEAIQGPKESDLDFLPMAAFFAVACATIPGFLFLPSKDVLETHTFKDETGPMHFRALFLSLLAMAVIIVGNSMMSLYETSKETNSLLDDIGNDDLVVAHELATNQRIEVGSNYLLGLIFVTIWLVPIFSLFFLPRVHRTHSDDVIMLPDDDDVDDDDEDDDASDNIEMERSTQRIISNDGEDPLVPGEKKQMTTKEKEEEERGLLAAPNNSVEDEEADVEANGGEIANGDDVEEETNMNLFEMLQTPSALLMLWTTTILVGAGTVETTNMGQMVEALGFPTSVTPASLALFSVAQAAGRVLTGSLSEAALNWNTHSFGIDNGVPRPFFLVVASLVGFVAHFLLGLARSEFVFVFGAALSGAAFGMCWPLMVLITGEVFGIKNVGANYMFFDGFTSAAGTLLLTKLVAQDVYEAHIDSNAPDSTTCLGIGCYQATHMVVAGLSLTCVVTSGAMLYTSRHVYNKTSLHAT